MSYDVVIIGSGCGGGSVAQQLAAAAHADPRTRPVAAARGAELGPEAVSASAAITPTRRGGPTTRRSPGMFYYVGGNTSSTDRRCSVSANAISANLNTMKGVSPARPINLRRPGNCVVRAGRNAAVRRAWPGRCRSDRSNTQQGLRPRAGAARASDAKPPNSACRPRG